MRFTQVADLVAQTLVIVPRFSGQVLRLGDVDVVTTAEVPARVYGTGAAYLSEGFWDVLTVVDGEYSGPPFSGEDSASWNKVWWEGTADDSSSYRVRNDPEYDTLEVFSTTSNVWSRWQTPAIGGAVPTALLRKSDAPASLSYTTRVSRRIFDEVRDVHTIPFL